MGMIDGNRADLLLREARRYQDIGLHFCPRPIGCDRDRHISRGDGPYFLESQRKGMLQACNRPAIFKRPGRILGLILKKELRDPEFRSHHRGMKQWRIPFSKADLPMNEGKGKEVLIAFQQGPFGMRSRLSSAEDRTTSKGSLQEEHRGWTLSIGNF